ncbi:MAG: diguanylate cyclase [Rhizobium sp.]|nr:diguanylate cyclase [Rhizobium sp.]
MTGMWDQYAGNIAFVGMAIAIWAHLSIWFGRKSAQRTRTYFSVMFGLAAGTTAIGSILLAVEASPGIFVDLRHAPLALAALFGGPAAALVSGAMVVAMRVWVGGAGMFDGLATVAMIAAIGLAVNTGMRKRQPRILDLFLTTAGLGAVLAVALMVLPTIAAADLLRLAGPELILLNCGATFLGGLILFMTRRTELERSILETAFSQSPDFIYVKDRNSRFLTVNDNMAKLYDAGSAGALVGRSDFDVMPRGQAEQIFLAEQEMMRAGGQIVDSFEQINQRFLLASKVPLRDREGRIVGLAGVTRDITERTTLENELRESKNLLALAMAGMSDGFAMFGRDGRLIFCNEQYRAAFPLSADTRVPGMHMRDILRRVAETRERAQLPEGSVEDWINAGADALHTSKDEEVELYNGDWRSIRTRQTDDGTVMIVVSDITANKHAETALRIAAEQLRNLADTDGLTGVLNRRAFDEAFLREAASSARDGTPLSVLMIDIDWFKAYNDTYGHPAGDECLRQVSRCLLDGIRRSGDLVARYGGEEFVVLLPAGDARQARMVADQVSARLVERALVHSGSPLGHLTVSIGMATGQGPALRANSSLLLATADGALYDAKAQGRNRAAEREFVSGSTALAG